MQTDNLLPRGNLSDAVVERLRVMITDGRLVAGERINEVHLAERLGISRTPLREALTRLTAEGALTALPRIGYFVCPLTIEEFEQIYPMRAILDPAALKLAGLPPRRIIERLKTLNTKIESEDDPARIIDLDDTWHRELLSACPNQILLGLIEHFMTRTRRYELALMREQANVARAVTDHSAVMSALETGDLDGACDALRANMTGGSVPIIAWLKSRNPVSEKRVS